MGLHYRRLPLGGQSGVPVGVRATPEQTVVSDCRFKEGEKL